MIGSLDCMFLYDWPVLITVVLVLRYSIETCSVGPILKGISHELFFIVITTWVFANHMTANPVRRNLFTCTVQTYFTHTVDPLGRLTVALLYFELLFAIVFSKSLPNLGWPFSRV